MEKVDEPREGGCPRQYKREKWNVAIKVEKVVKVDQPPQGGCARQFSGREDGRGEDRRVWGTRGGEEEMDITEKIRDLLTVTLWLWF